MNPREFTQALEKIKDERLKIIQNQISAINFHLFADPRISEITKDICKAQDHQTTWRNSLSRSLCIQNNRNLNR